MYARRMKLAWLVAIGVAGCVESGSVICANGESCPGGTTCIELTPADYGCATNDQTSACSGIADGERCALDSTEGSCIAGACFAIVCGNGRTEPGEVCDDGNTTSGDATCSANCQSTEACGNLSVDPIKLVKQTIGGIEMDVATPNEQCDDGNHLSGDGCSSTCIFEALRWSQVDAPITTLSGASGAYDAARGRVVLATGTTFGATTGSDDSAAVWEWTGSGWHVEYPAIRPQRRQSAMMAFDAGRKRMVLFGGTPSGRSAFGDTWEWDGEKWTPVLPAVSPPPRSHGGMVYDAARGKLVLFGGFDGRKSLNDLWEYDGTTWSQVTAGGTAPSERCGFVMAFDPRRAAIVVAGGSNLDVPPGLTETATPTLDTWELKSNTWSQVTAAVTPPELAGVFIDNGDPHALMAYYKDSLFIAYAKTEVATTNKTFQYNGATGTWSDLNTSAPGLRTSAVLASDPTTSSVLLYGGYDETTGIGATTTWRFASGDWTNVTATEVRPPMVNLAATAYDPLHHRTWVFGGATNGSLSAVVADLKTYDGGTWKRHTASGPSARYAAQLAYDRKRDRLVVFGGKPGSSAALQDTWLFDGTTWTNPTPATIPPARFGGAMTYDAVRGRVVMFAGQGISGALGDTWEWDGTNWIAVTTANSPGARALPAVTFDEVRGVLVLVSGFVGGLQLLNDIWTYDGTDWTLVQAPTPLIARLYATGFAYDVVARQSMFNGGINSDGAPLSDTWRWDGTWKPTFLATQPTPRGFAPGFASPNGCGVMIHSGSNDVDGGPRFDDTWLIRWENDQPRENCFVEMDNDGDGLNGCADPDCWATCTPGCLPGTTCDATLPKCGDGACSAIENCRICPGDCACTAACGDSFCDSPETNATCPGDCP